MPTVNALPVYTPIATCVTINADLPPIHPTVQTNHTPYLAPLSAIPYTSGPKAIPDSILQDLGNVAPTQYIWNTPHGALTYTPAHPSHPPLPNSLADLSPCSPRIVDVGAGGGNNVFAGPGCIPSPIPSDPSDSSSDCSDPDHFMLHPLLASNDFQLGEMQIEWNVSAAPDMARHVQDDRYFLANADAPATEPPTRTLRIEFCFIDQPGIQWNWDPITMRKLRPIRIADVLHAIYDYFQLQLTHDEYDIIKSYGKRNARIVANSWRERIASQPDTEAQSQVFHGGLRRVDCLGSSKIFAGLRVDGSQLELGLRA